MKKILSFVLTVVMLFSGIVFDSGKEVKAAAPDDIYDIIYSSGDTRIYLGGNLTLKLQFLDYESSNLMKNPDLSRYTILWEKYNKNTNNWEYYSNNIDLIIKNAKKDDFTEYRITLTNKNTDGYSPSLTLEIKEISKNQYEKENPTEEPTTEHKSEFKNFKNYCKIKKLNKNYNYTSKEIEPKIEVYSSNLKGTEYPVKLDPKYYTLTYKNNVKPGKASITITGKAPYYGSKTVTFNIKPNNAKLSKVKVKNKKIKITCKKVKCDGYEFRYKKSTLKWGKSASKKGWKTKTQKSNKFTSKKLKKGNYFVQVRSYVEVGNKKVYSNYISRDQMTVIGKSTKIEKGRFYLYFKRKKGEHYKRYKFYAPKDVSNKWGKVYNTSCNSPLSINMLKYNNIYFAIWKIADKPNHGIVYITDRKGNVIEKGRIEKVYK